MDIYPAADARSVRPGTVFHYKICRCITLPDGHSIHGTLAIVRWGQWGTPLAGSHRNLPFVSLLSLFFMNTRQKTARHDEEFVTVRIGANCGQSLCMNLFSIITVKAFCHEMIISVHLIEF